MRNIVPLDDKLEFSRVDEPEIEGSKFDSNLTLGGIEIGRNWPTQFLPLVVAKMDVTGPQLFLPLVVAKMDVSGP